MSSNLGDRTLADIADRHGKTVPQVIVRWHLQHETVVIPKSSRRDRIEANADVYDFELSDDEMRRIG
jgi:2,5-diketo-D-gluconate reductase A